MRRSSAAEPQITTGPEPAAPPMSHQTRPWLARPWRNWPRGGRLVRVDRVSMLLSGAGLLLVLAATVLTTLLVSGRADDGTAAKPTTAGHNPSITLNGPDVAQYIVDSYAVRGVTCPTVSVPVDGSFLCSDPNGTTYTVQIINHGQAYTVHPN